MADLTLRQAPLPGGIVLVEAEGVLDAHTFDEMQRLMDSLLHQKRYRVVVKLEKVHYVSSAGAGVLIGAVGTARENGGDLVLMKPHPAVRAVLDSLGLSAVFQIVETEAQALRAFP